MSTSISCYLCLEKLDQDLKCPGYGTMYKTEWDKRCNDESIVLDSNHPDTEKACKELVEE